VACRLNDKVAVVTGAAGGIGAATARAFVDEGARVIVADVQDERGEALASSLGDAARYLHADVTRETDVAATIAMAQKSFGSFDCIVNNAGLIGAAGSIATMDASHWHASMAALLDSVFFGTKHAAAALIARGAGGSILTTASIASLQGGLGAHPYTTAKHAIVGLTRSVASELAPHRIRVNAVAPGFVVTPLSMGSLGADADETAQRSAAASPMRLPMFPEEIARAFVYLASDDARQVTGQLITVDAGTTAAPNVSRYHEGASRFMGPSDLAERFRIH